MRSLVLSSTALFACGFSVFGRPLNTRQETGILNQNTPSWYQDLTSALPRNPFALATLPTLPILSPSMGTLASKAPSGSDAPDTSLPSEIKPDDPRLTSAYISTPDTGSNFQLDSGGDSITNRLSGSSFEMSDRILSPTISEDVQETLTNLKIRGYCIYELSPDRSELKFKTCDPSSDWETFRKAFDDSGIGFALYHLNDDTIFSITNLIHNHCQTKQEEKWVYNSPCDIDEESTLMLLNENWRLLVKKAFPNVYLVSYDSINTDDSLQRIGRTWNLLQNVSCLVVFFQSSISAIFLLYYLANAS